MIQTGAKIGRIRPSDRVQGRDLRRSRVREGVKDDRPTGSVNGKCGTCRGPLDARRSTKTFCSARCRMLAWAVEAVALALKDGKADGLKARIRELGRIL